MDDQTKDWRKRPPVDNLKKIDENQVYELASINCSLKEMAAVLRCDEKTLRNRFSHIISEGRSNGSSSLKKKAFQMALQGNTAMMLFMLKNLCGYSDKITWTDPTKDDGDDTAIVPYQFYKPEKKPE